MSSKSAHRPRRPNLLAGSWLAVAAFASPASAVELDEIVGVWQFPDRQVWIQVEEDGTARQCRLWAANEPPIVAQGKFQPPDHFEWETVWKTDKIEFQAGSLTIVDEKGTSSTFLPAKDDPADSCDMP